MVNLSIVTSTVTNDPRFAPVTLNGKTYITSQLLHKQKLEAGMTKYDQVKNFNARIREIETYEDMVTLGHMFVLKNDEFAGLESQLLIKSNSYRPILLIDAVAQKSIEQHLDDEQSKASAVQTNQSSAFQGLAGIDLTALDMSSPLVQLSLGLLQSQTSLALMTTKANNAIATKAHISNAREASALGKLGHEYAKVAKEVAAHNLTKDLLKDALVARTAIPFYTAAEGLIEFPVLKSVRRLGVELTKACELFNIEIGKQVTTNKLFPTVNKYPRDAFEYLVAKRKEK